MNKKVLFSLLATFVIFSMLVTACAPAAEAPAAEAPAAEAPAAEAPAAEAPAAEAPAAEAPAPFEGLSIAAPNCDYGGQIKEIKAVDALTVQFDLCVPDPAFLSKVAFSVFSVQPKEHLEAAMEDHMILEQPIGTGPYMVDSWNRGDSIVFKRNPYYWGEAAYAETLVFKWATEGAARLLELQSGTVDGIDNPTPDDFETIKSDPNLQLLDREGLNIFYVGMTNSFAPFDDVRVRQAVGMGIDRQRIVDNFLPKGSIVATHFTPCEIPNACVGEEWYAFDPEAGRALLAEAGYPDGFKTSIYFRDVFRGYLPEPGVVAAEIQAQLKENLNIDAEVVVMESGAFLDESGSGKLAGLHLLGWGADYPHVTNFLDYHFGKATLQFGALDESIWQPLIDGAQIADVDEAAPFYEAANNALKEMVPMVPISHAGSATAFKADVAGAHASPLTNETFAVMDPGGRDTLVWMQNAEPISLYCMDETDGESLRACEQVTEALLGYEVAGTKVVPGLATSCDPNEDLTSYVCHLREGVKFSDGSDLDANDVVFSWTVALDASHPLHIGNTGAFEYMTYLWGNLINAE